MHESVAIILFNDAKDQVLLIKRRDIDVWVLPGGGVDAGETPERAALREAEEETGCRVEIVRKIAFYTPLNRLTHPTHFYEGRIVEGTPHSGKETRAASFFPLTSLPSRLPPFYLYWIEDARSPQLEVLHKPIRGTSYFHFVFFLLTHPCLTLRFLLTRIGVHFNN